MARDELLWDYEIGAAAAATGIVIPFPQPPLSPSAPGGDELITPKASPEIKKPGDAE
jgi:hypothetical protein